MTQMSIHRQTSRCCSQYYCEAQPQASNEVHDVGASTVSSVSEPRRMEVSDWRLLDRGESSEGPVLGVSESSLAWISSTTVSGSGSPGSHSLYL